MAALRRICLRHADLVPVVILFIAFRVSTLLLYRPGSYSFDFNEYYFFRDLASRANEGYFPYLDLWMEHPPLLPWLAVLAYKIGLFLPPARTSDFLWFNLSFGLTLLPFEAGNLVLIYATVSRLSDRASGVMAAWIYSALVLPLFFWTAGLDCFPLFFLLLSIHLAVRNRPLLAGVATGLGFMAKIVPAVAGPAILMAFAARAKSRALVYCLAAGGAVLLIATPLAMANPTIFMASVSNILSRPSWGTVWALLDGYYGWGWVASLDTRTDPAAAVVNRPPSALPWMWINLAFAAIFVALITRRIDWQQPRKFVALVALSLNLFMLFNKGYSPQFIVYVLALIVILYPNLRGVVYCLLLSAVNILESPYADTFLNRLSWLMTSTITMRTILVVCLSIDCLAIVFAGRFVKAARFALPVVGSAVVVALIGLSVPATGYYVQWMQSLSPQRDFLEFLQAQSSSTVVLTDNRAYEHFYSFLRGRHDVTVTDGTRGLDARQLKRNVWLIYFDTEKDKVRGPLVEKWLAENAFPVDSRWVSNVRLTRYSTGLVELGPADVAFGKVARLSAYGFDASSKQGGILNVRLSWQLLEQTDKSYKVFLHLVDSTGQLIAQRDSVPANGLRPSQSWRPGETIVDNHGIPVPDRLPGGTYVLQVGLYDGATGSRLAVSAGGDTYDVGTVAISRQ